MGRVQNAGEEAPLVELKFLRRDGVEIDVEVASTPFQGAGPPAVQSVFQDVTRRKRFEQQMRLQATALGTAANAIVITDRHGVITWVNPAFTRLTGYTASEAIGQTSRILKSGVHDAAYYEALWSTVLGGGVWQSEQVNRRKDGSLYTEEQTITPVRDDWGQITHFVDIKQDISERKQNEQRLSYLASHDTLTGLPNRHALERALEQAVARARRGPTGALLFLDLDNFKLVNDTLGHAAGDQLLVALSQVLMERLRDGDILARIGGDEFAVLLEHATLGEAREVAERLRDSVDSYSYQMAGRSFTLGVSIGLARILGRHEPQILLAQADTAMYTAKEGGRNRVAVYRPGESSLQGLSEANQWIPRIRDALRDDGLTLYFQPVFRLSDLSVNHHEALLRMTGPAGEIILPGEFIAAAERFGLMQPIDHWVVREAIRQLERYPEARLVVNLSGHSRVDDDLMALIENELRAHGVEPARLGFEITETAAVQDLARAEFWVRRLKALGCQFALDDFGVGFTSFGYLRSLPVDQIKIDGSFIRNIDQDAGSRDIVLAMHSLARALGKETVAEAVENEATLAVLRGIGVTYVQGYYLGPPQPTLDRSPVAIA
jgi:diguanylate cyclase (GGDEF)-like protein/PAS domain S-box-containing protein